MEHADLIGAHLPASREALDSDVVLAAALVRWVGIVGEAAARLSESFRRSHPEVPWPRSPACGTTSSTGISRSTPTCCG
jgi:uncharacterized protein with HEPN domain